MEFNTQSPHINGAQLLFFTQFSLNHLYLQSLDHFQHTYTQAHTHTLSLFLAVFRSLTLSYCVIVPLWARMTMFWKWGTTGRLTGPTRTAPSAAPLSCSVWWRRRAPPRRAPRWSTTSKTSLLIYWLCICEIRSSPLQTWNKWNSPKSATPNYLALRYVLYLELSQYSWNTIFPSLFC